jgi:hypothetical protein
MAVQPRIGINNVYTLLLHTRVPFVFFFLSSFCKRIQIAKEVFINSFKLTGAQNEFRDKQGHSPYFLKLLRTAE